MEICNNSSGRHVLEKFAGKLALVIFIVSVIIFYRHTQRADTKIESGGVTVRNVSYSLDTDHGSIEVDYPQFSGGVEPLNKDIENYIAQTRGDFEANVRDNLEAENETTASSTDTESVKNYMYLAIDWSKAELHDDRISILVRTECYSGGAHGSEVTKSFNWDVKKQRELTLADLFSKDKNYLAHLSQTSAGMLMSTLGNDGQGLDDGSVSWIKEGTAPDLKNFSVFTVKGNSIKIYFQQYQVAPYAVGSPTVDLSISNIQTTDTATTTEEVVNPA